MLRILKGQTVISGVKVPVLGLGSAWTLSCVKREPTLFGQVITREEINPRNQSGLNFRRTYTPILA